MSGLSTGNDSSTTTRPCDISRRVQVSGGLDTGDQCDSLGLKGRFYPGSAMTKPVTKKKCQSDDNNSDFFMRSLLLLLPIFSAIVRLSN